MSSLTKGHNGGIYNGPIFRRNFVTDKAFGVPFVTSAIMLRADLSEVPYLSKRDAYSNKLKYLELKKGMIMVSCSGAIGNMIYVREDMEGYWSCQDQIKIVADKGKIHSGYLYAYLNSKYGLPLILSGTYGAIIQHLEPIHISDLPVPRLDEKSEEEAHLLVEKAADNKSEFIRLNKVASSEVENTINWKTDENVYSKKPKINIVTSREINEARRLDVLYFSSEAERVETLLEKKDWKFLTQVADIVKPGMFKRIMSKEEDGGIPFHTGSELFLMDAKPKYFVSRKTQHIEQCILEPHWVLLQAFGQRGGLIARVMLTTKNLEGASATDLQIQIKAHNKYDAGYIFAYLNSAPGYQSIIRLPIGGSIPHIYPKDVGKVKIPWPDETIRQNIGSIVLEAWSLRDEAKNLENEAISLIERSIESAALKH